MLGVLTPLLMAAAKKTTSSSSEFIIFLVLIALVGYFLLIRPQKQRQRRQRQQQSDIGVGDEVVTVGGIVGRVIAMDAEHVTILSGGDTVGFPAVGNEPTRLVMVRNAIARKIEPRVVSDPTEDHGDAGEVDDEDDTADERSGNGHGRLNGHDGDEAGAGDGRSPESEGTSP